MKQTKTQKPKMPKSEIRKLRSLVAKEAAQVASSASVKTRKSNNPPPASSTTRPVRGHRETFSEQLPYSLNGTTTGASQMIAVNPGDQTIFTRLYQLANLYQEYRFHKLKIRYIPNGSAFAANNQTGEIVIAATDNFHSSPSVSVSAARARTPSVAGNAWEPITLTIPNSILGRWRSLRSSSSCLGGEPNMFDFLVEVYLYQTPNTNGLGYIEMTGDVEMRGDYVTNINNAPLTNRCWAMVQTNNQTVASGVATDLVVTGASILPNSIISGVYNAAGVTFGIAGGTYRIEARAYVQGTTITSCVLVPNIFGASYSNKMPSNPGIGGPTFSVGGLEVSNVIVVSIPEDYTGNVTYTITVIGTGTLTINDWNVCVLAL